MAHLAPLIAALTVDLSQLGIADGEAPRVIKLLPAGSFRARDGRPVECAAWTLDTVSAASLIAEATQREVRYVIDYEHQTLRSVENGQPAPASGWFGVLEWREDGLYATDVEWTATAAAMILAKEYRYLSPVFTYDKQGRVTGLLHVALTNNPALDELPELQVAALSRLVSLTQSVTQEDSTMDELIEQLRWLLNLPVGASADDIKAQLQKLIDQLSGGQGTAAASVDLVNLVGTQQQRIAVLSANQADPARFVSVETMRALQDQVAALTAQQQGRQVDELVTAALSDGRLLAAQEGWARDLGHANLDALQGYLATAPKIAALSSTQTQGHPPASDPVAGLDANTLAVCSMFGNDPAAVAAAMKE
ncbi:phage protease [Laribacter hongkongensis]|uniref:phage protease n=3 Tax=Laribacter hongkongensis TaxID=168471 RepID=UPI001EFE5C81|nr:phage protease [Laribacter hongkongensis]MCG8993223.1 phage protease [Laribacter hongkongensis]MCG8997958.1 phage protease [Laribacter hongkongensis]MCG9002331.1 phage protease [Laribacter hongkongensis]MCG9005641.1 phage protease [Laribacter hongkongensis]MCG9008778.1 phage protease [Laribacter hongkongensis]